MAAASSSKRPSAAPAAPSPTLQACVKSLIALGREAAAPSTRHQAALAHALMGFSVQLGKDQDALASLLRNSAAEASSPFPFSELPAMRALVTDPALFQCVVSLLSHQPHSGGATGASSAGHMPQGRKRSPSEDLSNNAARKKPILSPAPSMHRARPQQAQISAGESKGQVSENSIPVFAATMLYLVFQHSNHWPVQFMEAFAEDSFGPRNWVDDERCRTLVANLEASLDQKQDLLDQTSVADDAETYYSSLMAPIKTPLPSSNKAETNGAQLKPPSMKERRQQQAKMAQSSDDSSSSGEEEVLEAESQNHSSSRPTPSHSQASDSILDAIFRPNASSRHRIRPRYHVHSLELASEAISEAFQRRLNSKSKQNYRLLQTLTSLPILVIPRVRCLASRHLERWLQSPALAGMARTLLSRIVQELQCSGPTSHDDLEVIENILKLNLKANQLSMHIDNVTAIAKNLPTERVARSIFSHCLQGECSSGSSSNALNPNDDHLRMLSSAYAVLDQKIAANALASSVSSLASDVINQSSQSTDVEVQLQSISHLLNVVVDALGKHCDVFCFVAAIIKAQSGTSNTMAVANSTARLIFECALLTTRTVPTLQTSFETAARQTNKRNFNAVGERELTSFRQSMLELRKMILRWCVDDLCRVYHGKIIKDEETQCADTYFERGAVTRGPGAPDYHSVLVDGNGLEESDRSAFCRLMSLIRCTLFLSSPSSKELEDMGRRQRISFICQYGVDVDDEMLQSILSSPNVTPNTAISIVENLLLRCGSDSSGKISCNASTVWRMYDLCEYSPAFRSDVNDGNNSSNDGDSSTSAAEASDMELEQKGTSNRPEKSNLPRLAISSLWWRVSSIALVLSGLLPEEVGASMFQDNPTVRAVIRMTTSQKYRFPTADCDDAEKERVRLAEESVKEREANIAERLFVPPKLKRSTKPKPQLLSPTQHRRGLRSSARQREKKEKLLAVEEERQAAALHAENVKLRKVLRILQKNVMLWDPKQNQRKPPKGSIDLLLAVNERFDLAEKFRLSSSPDFLLETIGEGRSAIERAYDWLIPVISSHPGTIERLQPSSTCFLLLRAYGAEGDKDSKLLDLTAPLMSHVKDCVTGESGAHALLAMELLLQDIADESDERRRCARKVLDEAFGSVETADFSQDHCGWLQQIVINVEKHKELVPLAIKYLSRALAYERGKVLGIYLSALSQIEKDADFVPTLCELIAARPHHCSESFDADPHLRALAIAKVSSAFEQAMASSCTASLVILSVSRDGQALDVAVSSSLLHAAIILISIWQKGDHDEDLLRYLITPAGSGDCGGSVSGLSSAKYRNTGKLAVSVDEWVLLAKARDEDVAKHAALSAPIMFLPRLLLCCGMPVASFHAMLKRLDAIGDSSAYPEKTYEDLISSTATMNRRTIKQKLHGRILAYMRVYSQAEDEGFVAVSKSRFVSWLSSEIMGGTTPTVSPGESRAPFSFAKITSYDIMEEGDDTETLDGVWSKAEAKDDGRVSPSDSLSEEFVTSCIVSDQYNVLEKALHTISLTSRHNNETEGASLAAKALLAVFKSHRDNTSFVRMITKWIPLLTQDSGEDHLWQLIFLDAPTPALICQCALKWSDGHISSCQEWIAGRTHRALSLRMALRFLVVSSGQKSIHCFDGSSSSVVQFPPAQKADCAMALTKLALTCLNQEPSPQAENGSTHRAQRKGAAAGRNTLPDWLVLIVLLFRSQPALISRTLVEESNQSQNPLELSGVLLRLYCLDPTKMNLSDAGLRNTLLKASRDHVPSWVHWRCPLDCQLSEMLSNVTRSPHQRLLQSTIEMAKQHPLIFVRHLDVINQRLVEDGAGSDSENQVLLKRGRLSGRHPMGNLAAQVGDRTVNVRIVLWGYSFSESIWTSALDVLAALPNEVAFTCGIKLGLTTILETYVTLMVVQSEELNAESNIVRVREKFLKFLESFQRCKSEAFEGWMETNIPQRGNVRDLLREFDAR